MYKDTEDNVIIAKAENIDLDVRTNRHLIDGVGKSCFGESASALR